MEMSIGADERCREEERVGVRILFVENVDESFDCVIRMRSGSNTDHSFQYRTISLPNGVREYLHTRHVFDNLIFIPIARHMIVAPDRITTPVNACALAKSF